MESFRFQPTEPHETITPDDATEQLAGAYQAPEVPTQPSIPQSLRRYPEAVQDAIMDLIAQNTGSSAAERTSSEEQVAAMVAEHAATIDRIQAELPPEEEVSTQGSSAAWGNRVFGSDVLAAIHQAQEHAGPALTAEQEVAESEEQVAIGEQIQAQRVAALEADIDAREARAVGNDPYRTKPVDKVG